MCVWVFFFYISSRSGRSDLCFLAQNKTYVHVSHVLPLHFKGNSAFLWWNNGFLRTEPPGTPVECRRVKNRRRDCGENFFWGKTDRACLLGLDLNFVPGWSSVAAEFRLLLCYHLYVNRGFCRHPVLVLFSARALEEQTFHSQMYRNLIFFFLIFGVL